MNFIQHFNSLLIPLKATSKIFNSLFLAIAGVFDSLHEFSKMILNSHFISNNSSLILFAQDRGITKIKGESEESFQIRVLNAYQFLKLSPTRQGIENIIKSSVSKNFVLRELYQEDFILDNEQESLEETTILSDDSSNYYFVVEFSQSLTVEEKSYVEEIIELYKPAHIGYHISATILDNFILDDDAELLEYNTYLGE